jgi:hypothetical protein
MKFQIIARLASVVFAATVAVTANASKASATPDHGFTQVTNELTRRGAGVEIEATEAP